MLCMIFGQLTGRDSMRDLILSLEAHKNKYYHLGFGSTVTVPIWGKQTGIGIIASMKSLLTS